MPEKLGHIHGSGVVPSKRKKVGIVCRGGLMVTLCCMSFAIRNVSICEKAKEGGIQFVLFLGCWL